MAFFWNLEFFAGAWLLPTPFFLVLRIILGVVTQNSSLKIVILFDTALPSKSKTTFYPISIFNDVFSLNYQNIDNFDNKIHHKISSFMLFMKKTKL
jgi:hypothetical protein